MLQAPHIPLAEAVADLMPRARDELAQLVAYRSVADPSQFPKSDCEKAAGWVANALRAEGFTDVERLPMSDGAESVYGYLPGPEGSPTVLLYAHYDVQPPLDEGAWLSPPFELTERNGRWYGRGAADCKGGLMMHLTALRALRHRGDVPVSVKVIADGSEEQGSGGLERYAEAHPELLAADTIVIGDAGNVRVGVPTVTATLRGTTVIEIAVHTLEGNLHSGQFGGAAPDALAALIRILDSLRDESGATVIAGLEPEGRWQGLQYEEAQFRSDARVLDGVDLMGTGTIADRLWARPALTVLGIDSPRVIGATPSVQASARALVSLRVPPGTDAHHAGQVLTDHLMAAVPWGARLEVMARGHGQPFRADTSSLVYSAMADALRVAYDGAEMEIAGHGGTIPICNTLASLYPQAEFVLIGLSEPEAQIHAVNESVSPQELQRLALAEALFLTNYATGRDAERTTSV